MAAIPSFPKGKPWEHLPTFEVLQQRSGMKVTKLREVLREVPKFKCLDNTVRYEEASAKIALDGFEPSADELDDVAAEVSTPLSTDPVQAALQVMNRTLSLFSVVVRERGDIVKLTCDTIKTMGEPLKLGQELVRENVQLLTTQVENYSKQHLDVLRLVHELHDAKADRENKAIERAERSKYRRETFDLAKTHLPKAIEKFQLTGEAGLALELLQALDPDALGPIVELALPPEMHAKAGKLVAMLKARRAARPVDTTAEDKPPEQEGPEHGQSHDSSEAAV